MTKTRLSKAKQLAKRRETQIWVLLSPKEATALLHGLVPSAVHRQLQRLVEMKGKRS